MQGSVRTRHLVSIHCAGRSSRLTLPRTCVIRSWNIASCASALGVSKRYIHMIFEAMGLQYGSYVLQEHLARSRDDLASPILASLSIERIAYRNGFNDAAHFSRRFRAAFGMSAAGLPASRRGVSAFDELVRADPAPVSRGRWDSLIRRTKPSARNAGTASTISFSAAVRRSQA